MELKYKFIENHKELRKKYELSNSQLSKLLNLKSPTSISNLEAGRALPSFEVLNKLLNLFSISSDWLFGISEVMYSVEFIAKREYELIPTFMTLSIPVDLKYVYIDKRTDFYSLDERADIIFYIQATMVNAEQYLPLLYSKLSKKD